MKNGILNTRKQLVLVIDDDAAQLKTIADILESEDMQPICCSTGKEALKAVKQQELNVAILDLRLPDIEDLDLLKKLKQNNPEIKVIINTGYSSLESALEAINEDVYAYVRKMGNVEELLAHVHRAFHKHLTSHSVKLEREVRKRTEELIKANKVLEKEITERIQADEALSESEEKFRSLAEKSPNMIFINQLGRIVYVNEKCEEIMKYKKEEFYSKDFDFLNLLAPESKSFAIENFQKHKMGEVVPSFEYTLLAKDGRRINAINTTRLIKYGGERAIFGIITDITERKRAEEKLRDKETRLLKAQQVARMGFLDWNLKTNEIVWSDEVYRLFGFEPQEGSQPIEATMKLAHPDDLEFVRQNLELAIQGVKDYNIDHRMIRTDGEIIWVHAQAELILDAEGNPASLLGTIVDISERKQSEESLQESERKYSELVNQAPDAIIALDHTGKITSVNQAFERLLGQNANNFIGKEFFKLEFNDKKELTKAKEEFGRVIQGKEIQPSEWCFTRKDKQKRVIEASPQLIRREEEIIGLLVIFRDITKRKRAELELSESEERYKVLFQRSLHPITIYDRNANIIMLNDIGAKNLKKPLHEINGKPIGNFIPETHELTVNRVRQVLSTGESLSVEDEISLPDGKQWFLSTLHPVVNPKGQPELVQVISYDITERRQAEEALRKSEEQFRITTEETGQLMYSFDPKTGKVKWAGAVEAVTGYTYEEYQSFDVSDWAEQIHPDDRERIIKAMDEALEHHTRFDTEYRFRRKDDSYIFVEEHGAFVSISVNAPYPIVGTIKDITERKRAEEKVRITEAKFKNTFDISPGLILYCECYYRLFYRLQSGSDQDIRYLCRGIYVKAIHGVCSPGRPSKNYQRNNKTAERQPSSKF